MSTHTITSTDATFQQDVLQSAEPVIVDFWAAWCGPCKMIAPILDDIATEYAGKIKVAKIDVDQNTAVPAQYGIRSIPSLLLFKQGQLVATQVGALSKSQLTAFIENHI